jgi:hypothetical protein
MPGPKEKEKEQSEDIGRDRLSNSLAKILRRGDRLSCWGDCKSCQILSIGCRKSLKEEKRRKK